MDPLKSEEYEAVLEHGVDLRGRRIFLHGDVELDTIGVAIRGIYLMADISSEPINLLITSYGGEIDEAFALHDVTRTVKAPVHTTAIGMCMSAAPLLLACGEKGHRLASENCEFMLHSASLQNVDGSVDNVQATAEAATRRSRSMNRLLAKYTTKRYAHWAKFDKSNADHYFDVERALEWGLIDGVWDEKS